MSSPNDRPRVLTQVDGDVWRITLDRPDAGNALDPAMAHQLADALQARPEQTRVVLLLGQVEQFYRQLKGGLKLSPRYIIPDSPK